MPDGGSGEIGKVVRCPNGVTNSLTFQAGPPTGPISEFHVESASTPVFGAMASWATSGMGCYLTSPAHGLTHVDLVAGTRTTARPFPDCGDLVDVGNTIWNDNRTCAN